MKKMDSGPISGVGPRKGLVISVTASIIVLVALLAACAESAIPTPTPIPTSTATPTATPVPTPTATLTPTPTPTPTTAPAPTITPTPDKGEDTSGNLMCGIGPVEPRGATGEDSETQLQPRCPMTPSENAQPIFALATCSFGKDEKECIPIPVQTALSGMPGLHFNLINPNSGIPPGCAGELFISVLSTSNGGAEIRWEGQEKDPQTCDQTGPDITGSTELPGPCCQRFVDIHYPEQDFTFRVLVQMDWQD